jgi:hypothetical protein
MRLYLSAESKNKIGVRVGVNFSFVPLRFKLLDAPFLSPIEFKDYY